MCANDSIRDIFFQTIYGLISESAQSGGPAQGSNFWNLYTVGIADDDPFKVTLADNSTMAIVAAHVRASPPTAHSPQLAAHSSSCAPAVAAACPAEPALRMRWGCYSCSNPALPLKQSQRLSSAVCCAASQHVGGCGQARHVPGSLQRGDQRGV